MSGSTLRVALVAGGWLVALLAGFAGLERYASAAGDAQPPAADLTRTFAPYRSPHRSLAVMALHPKCPCTTASLAEFGDFIARAGSDCDALIVHVVPNGAGSDWRPEAVRMLGGREVPVLADLGGKLAEKMGAQTSGHIVLIDSSGEVRFFGGITRSRGHRGRSTGQDAMLATVNGSSAAAEFCSAPVYGCALDGAATTSAKTP